MSPLDAPYTVLACLSMHRMATSTQLHTLVGIQRTERTTRYLLQKLTTEGLVASVNLPGGKKLWMLTPTGRDLCASFPEVREREHPLIHGDTAHLRRRAPHTLAVLRTHLAFLTDARARRDEYGPLDWEPEIYHRLSDQRADALIADALMRYTANGPNRTRRQLRAFVEVDRCTMGSERLASKLMTYGRFLEYAPVPVGAGRRTGQAAPMPVWQRYYPVYPRVLFVLTGASRTVMERRIDDLRAMTAANPLAIRLARTVPLGAAVLEDLEQQGPAAAVWTPLAGEDLTRRGWMDL